MMNAKTKNFEFKQNERLARIKEGNDYLVNNLMHIQKGRDLTVPDHKIVRS